jgi:hypothetical protein
MILLLPAALVGWMQFVSPIGKYDDLMYHGSRAGYWLHSHSVFPFVSHNERQEAFPYAGDLIFAFGVFTAHSETLGRMLVFVAYPALLFLTAGILRKHGVRPGPAIAAACVVGVTPQVFSAALGIKPELWGALFALIALDVTCNALDASNAGERRKQCAILLAAIAAAIGTKFTYLILIPLGFVPFLLHRRRDYLFMLTVGACAMLVFGLPVTLSHNRTHYQGWLGSPTFTSGHRPDPGVTPIVRHLERLPFTLVGVPWVPSARVRHVLETTLQAAADGIGASRPLRMERPDKWPGRFSTEVPKVDTGYSLLWVGAFGVLVASLGSNPRMRRDRTGRMALAYIAFAICFTAGVACTVRWQIPADVPRRFLIAGSVAMVIGSVTYWQHTKSGQPVLSAAVLALSTFHALPFLNEVRHLFAGDIPYRQPESVLMPAADVVPPGARVLLVASQDSGDYVLFHPKLGFPTAVVTWGQRPFASSQIDSTLRDTRVNAVVFEGEQVWWPREDFEGPESYASTEPFRELLERQTDFVRQPGGYPNIVYLKSPLAEGAAGTGASATRKHTEK